MGRDAESPEEMLRHLAETPERLAVSTAGWSAARLGATPPQGGWSVNEVLAHLRSCSDVFGTAIRLIATQDRPTFRAVDPRTWARQTDYPTVPFPDSLEAFAAQRAELLAFLAPLTADDWARTGTVTGAGAPLQRTVWFYAEWLRHHERSHFKPIERILRSLGE